MFVASAAWITMQSEAILNLEILIIYRAYSGLIVYYPFV